MILAINGFDKDRDIPVNFFCVKKNVPFTTLNN